MPSQKIADYSSLNIQGDITLFLETRIENDGSGNPLYIGYTKIPNADTASGLWYIVKLSYSGGFLIRTQLPDSGAHFTYVWDDRATLFS